MNQNPRIDLTLPGDLDFGAAVEKFYQALYRFGFSLAGSEADAADLTQETYRVLLTKAGTIRDPHKVKGWLFTTLYRLFLKRRRLVARFPEASLESVEEVLPAVGPGPAEHLDSTLVVAALQRLEEKYRTPLILFYLNEHSYLEIAALLELPPGTIMSRLSRGKALLRRQLQTLSPARLTAHPNAA